MRSNSFTVAVLCAAFIFAGCAGYELGPERLHSNELVGGRDKFMAQTFLTVGDPIPNVKVATEQIAGQPVKRSEIRKELIVFIPRGATPDRNQVHVFFLPDYAWRVEGTEAGVAQQGLRATTDDSAWILIAVPALDESDQPDIVTINTDEIVRCLTAAGRKPTIDAIRLSAHSRGYRGLVHTLGLTPNEKPLVDLSLVEKVTVFDASYHDVGAALTVHKKALVAMADPANPGHLKPDDMLLYEVNVNNISGLKTTKLNPIGLRALSYARLVQDGLALGKMTQQDVDALPAHEAANRVLQNLANCPRGSFSTHPTTPAGKVSLQTFIENNLPDLKKLDDPNTGLKSFINDPKYRLDGGNNYSRENDAHHWFVSELAHEAVE